MSETPAELSTLIDGLLWTFEDDGSESESHAAARSALMALYTRQREEIEDEKAISKRQGEAIAELCREIERLKAEQRQRDEDFGTLDDAYNALIGRTADHLTPEEAKAIVEWCYNSIPVARGDTFEPHETRHSALAKLRLQSGGTTDV